MEDVFTLAKKLFWASLMPDPRQYWLFLFLVVCRSLSSNLRPRALKSSYILAECDHGYVSGTLSSFCHRNKMFCVALFSVCIITVYLVPNNRVHLPTKLSMLKGTETILVVCRLLQTSPALISCTNAACWLMKYTSECRQQVHNKTNKLKISKK